MNLIVYMYQLLRLEFIVQNARGAVFQSAVLAIFLRGSDKLAR